MTVALVYGRDKENNLTPCRTKATSVDKRTLSATTNTQFTVPAGYDRVIIGASGDIWVNLNANATLPTGSTTNDGSELNPVGYMELVGGTTVINIISSGTPSVSLAYYSSN